jgi:hypothetical protein
MSPEGPRRFEKKESSPQDFKDVKLKEEWADISKRIAELFGDKAVPEFILLKLNLIQQRLISEERSGGGMRKESWYETRQRCEEDAQEIEKTIASELNGKSVEAQEWVKACAEFLKKVEQVASDNEGLRRDRLNKFR